MLNTFLPADACDPSLPGCNYEPSSEPVSTLVVLAIVGLGLLMLLVGTLALIAFLIQRRKPTTGSAAATSPVPPGWFPDPADNSRWRWWNGQSWTENVSGPGPAGNDSPDGPSV